MRRRGHEAGDEVAPIDGPAPMRMVRSPVQFDHVQFDHAPFATSRAPQSSELTGATLLELGLEGDGIAYLKASGAVHCRPSSP